MSIILLLDALECGADIVVQSTHKSLNAMSQAAVLHLHRGNIYFFFFLLYLSLFLSLRPSLPAFVIVESILLRSNPRIMIDVSIFYIH